MTNEQSEDVALANGLELSARALIDRASVGIFRAASDGRFLLVNAALTRLLGYPDASALLAANLERDILWDEDERRRWRQGLEVDRLAEWKEMSWRRFNGTLMRVRLSLHVAPDVHGRPLTCEGIVEDVSQRARMDEIARRSERMASLGRTLAGVAHEINNPLTAIIGFAQILLRGAQPASDRQALETVVREAQRAARIVKDLLTIARREESTLQEAVDLNEIVTSILNSQRYAIETRGIRLELRKYPTAVAVRGDPVQLEQVVLNLLVNARQAVETRSDRARRGPASATAGWEPSITIRTLVRAGLARVEIADNGEGIAATDLPHIWDPFWTKRDEGEGTGLGLAVVHGIIASHGGTIDAASDERAGTVLTITLPVDVRPPEPQHERDGDATERDSGERPRPLDILIVDDEASLRDLLQRLFSNRGHAVMTAVDGAQAIRLAEQSTFDVVVCDLRMPGMDGRDVITHLSKLETCAKTRFVLSTGDATMMGGPLLIGDTRVDAVVSKPFRVAALLEVVEGGARS